MVAVERVNPFPALLDYSPVGFGAVPARPIKPLLYRSKVSRDVAHTKGAHIRPLGRCKPFRGPAGAPSRNRVSPFPYSVAGPLGG